MRRAREDAVTVDVGLGCFVIMLYVPLGGVMGSHGLVSSTWCTHPYCRTIYKRSLRSERMVIEG
jgi:hypothetical protein